MIDCQFHETKRERKFYEGKKQKALTYIDHTSQIIQNLIRNDVSNLTKDKIKYKMIHLRKVVNDI